MNEYNVITEWMVLNDEFDISEDRLINNKKRK